MNPAQLLNHFDLISNAPDAIPRLRSFILDLAVYGKLVEQDPRDEPASELLKHIQFEKVRLVHVGEIRKRNPLPAIEESETPFAIPGNWQWVRLNDITSYIQRGKSPKYAVGEGIPVISQKCVQWGGLELESAKLITCESIEEYEPIRFLRRGDLLWNSTGTGTIGRIIKVKEPPPKLVCDSHVTVVRCLEVDAEYVRSWLRSDHVYAVIEDRAAGSTNQVELTSQLAMNQVVPLPPLAEQQRIVAKIDELMALCDRLEVAQVERENRRDSLVASSLNRLNNGADPAAFRNHARFYFNHLPRLTTRKEHIQQLRQTILNLAVRGKLVPQDHYDEPASESLKRIQAEKARLLKEGTLARQKLASSEPEELACDCPMNWQAVNFNDVCNLVTSGSRGWAEFYSDTGPKFIRAQNIRFGRLRLEDLACVSLPKKTEGTRTQISRGDLLIVITGAGVTNPAMLDHDLGEAYVSQHVALIKPTATSLSRWLLLCLMAPVGARAELVERAYGAGKPGLNLDNIRFLRIPLPPLAEQQRIVAKVDELMTLCDRLEAQLTTTQTESRRLLEAVLHEVLTAADHEELAATSCRSNIQETESR